MCTVCWRLLLLAMFLRRKAKVESGQLNHQAMNPHIFILAGLAAKLSQCLINRFDQCANLKGFGD